MKKANRVIAILLILFSIFFYYMATTFPKSVGTGVGHAFFPKWLSVLLIILAIFLFFIKEKHIGKIFELEKSNGWRMVIGILALILYIFFIQIIGFVISSIIFAILWMYLMGNKKNIKRYILPIISAIIISIVFEKLLNVNIPHGILY